MPYSLNEKVGLVSIPVSDLSFDIESAKPEQVEVVPFKLDAIPGEAMELAEIATNAKPGLLILYHHLFHGVTEDELLQEVRERYSGDVVSGKDLEVY